MKANDTFAKQARREAEATMTFPSNAIYQAWLTARSAELRRAAYEASVALASVPA